MIIGPCNLLLAGPARRAEAARDSRQPRGGPASTTLSVVGFTSVHNQLARTVYAVWFTRARRTPVVSATFRQLSHSLTVAKEAPCASASAFLNLISARIRT